jgi:molybdopterin-guanine dinucleotide biosynthesis protein A/rhodanese-related sulfurtransferase
VTAGAVLCGGRSTRMGTDKAFVEVGRVPMAARVATTLTAAGCAPVTTIGGDVVLLSRLGYPAVADRWPGAGPAGGVLTALGAVTDDLVVIAACDLPALDTATVHAIVDALAADVGLGAAVAVTDRPQQSLTAWRRSVATSRIEAAWDAGTRSVHGLLDAVPRVDITVAPGPLRNVNTTAELEEAAVVARYIDAVSVQEIDVDQLASRLADGARLVDVREPDEYADGHVPGAVLVPLGTVPEHLDAFAGDGPTYVICKTGGRSMRAAEYAAEQGIDAVNVIGGTMAWIASGRETVGGDQPS